MLEGGGWRKRYAVIVNCTIEAKGARGVGTSKGGMVKYILIN